jgi:hypothetical protein
MKYYETNYDEYLYAYDKYNIHPELDVIKQNLPKTLNEFKNLIMYGSSGVGKYTQTLSILQNYSPSKLKYDKKIFITIEKQEKKTKSVASNVNTITTEKPKSNYMKKKAGNNTTTFVQIKKEKKHEFIYRISDIHYEIDMATLGCNSKLIWHDLFFQIVDIVSVSTDKIGIILCKNFHAIHNELLDIFYSYMRHPLHHMNIKIKFILLSEHIGFIPDNILNICQIIPVKRPTKEVYQYMSKIQTKPFSCFIDGMRNGMIFDKTSRTVVFHKNKTEYILNDIDMQYITNAKEIHSFAWLKNTAEIPIDVFNIICDTILENILQPQSMKITELRNNLYDLLIYNIDVTECVWYLFTTLINQGRFTEKESITKIINDIFVFLKYYNNNYRSIYHLESIILSIINKIHYNESSIECSRNNRKG